MSDDRAGEKVFGGLALGCGLLLLEHLAGYGAAVLLGALGSVGDPSLVLFAPLVYLGAAPFVQPLWAGPTALALAAAGRRPMALGVVIGSALSFVLGTACAGAFLAAYG